MNFDNFGKKADSEQIGSYTSDWSYRRPADKSEQLSQMKKTYVSKDYECKFVS